MTARTKIVSAAEISARGSLCARDYIDERPQDVVAALTVATATAIEEHRAFGTPIFGAGHSLAHVTLVRALNDTVLRVYKNIVLGQMTLLHKLGAAVVSTPVLAGRTGPQSFVEAVCTARP